MTAESIVVDSSVIIKWFVPEPNSAQANLIYDDYKNGSLELLAPDFIYAEIGNILWKKQIFQAFDPLDVKFAIESFQKVNFAFTPITTLFDDAYQIAVRYKRTFYDLLYLALSLRENCRFVTADERLYNSVNADLPNIVWLANWK